MSGATSQRAHRLPPNRFDHFYRGGVKLGALRPDPAMPDDRGPDDTGLDDQGVNDTGSLRRPEEWLASTVARWGSDGVGLAALDDGTRLVDLIADDPAGWLGADHAARWGSSPALLVKLLDAGERLPVHVHPDRAFAARHLDCPFGKSEAWVVIGTPVGGGSVYVGATRPVAGEEWAELVAGQDTETMLGLLNELTVHPGDAVFIPAGTPHAIDAGLFVVELQEPTDFSILLEWDGFDIDGPRDGHLGLGVDTALGAVRHDAVDDATLGALVRRAEAARPITPALPALADGYFRAWRVEHPAPVVLPAGFAVVVVLDGDGSLCDRAGRRPVAAGDAYVVPDAAGPVELEGRLAAVVAQPPDPATTDPATPDSGAGR